MSFKQNLLKIPLLGRFLLILYRLRFGFFTYFSKPLRLFIVWLFKSKELSNFSYELTPKNKLYLALYVANITGESIAKVKGYISELEQDESLKTHVRENVKTSEMKYIADIEMMYGRRIGWYALVRSFKPKVLIETGVDKGLGSCILTSALRKNTEEGFPGYYYGTELDTRLGYLLKDDYSKYGEILYGDSVESLKKFEKKIDFFINDSDHSAEYEALEYQTIKDKLAENALILGDNAHVTDKLANFALETERDFVFFKEEPLNHWYPGAGIGVALNSKSKS